MAEALTFQIDLPVSTERAYRAWLDSYEVSRFTKKPAKIQTQPGGDYFALDGAVRGQTLVATPFSHIVQTWRAEDFPEGVPDSQVDIMFEPTCTGCQLTINQTGIPAGMSKRVLERWENEYLRPLKTYFDVLVGDHVEDIDG